MTQLNSFVIEHASATWVYIVVYAVCTIDGFFPPIPSESIVVGLAAVSATAHQSIVLLFFTAALGAFSGDNLAYLIGRRFGSTRFVQGGPRRQRALGWAKRNLERRAIVLIICARFVPIGRVAVNLTAGITRFDHRKFLLITTISAFLWSGYSIVIGTLAGKLLHDQPLLAALLGIVLAITLGALLDFATQRYFRRRAKQ